MSFRDVRNFLEMMRALGYPSLISMESFRTPNFPLVADLLVWLAKRFDPDVDIPPEIDTEDDRVKLIRNAAQFMALKANIKLNTKRLYQADGYAVKELLKITSLLYDALNMNLEEKEDENFEEEMLSLKDFDLSDKINELKLSRQLASEITTTGATLFDLLGKEVELKAARHKSVSRQYEINEVEAGIKKAIEALKTEIDESKQLIDNVSATEANLDNKIERRKVEIDRYEKRLQTLKKVRPAFMEEFTALEAELEQLFVQYSTRVRILNQLERLVSETERQQLEKQLQMVSPRIETIPLEGGTEAFLELEESEARQKQERPRASTGGRTRTAKTAKAYGGMQPPMSATPSLSSDSEDDELFIDKDESELIQSDDESLGLELSGMELTKRVQSGKPAGNKLNDNSDDDF
ncbi:Clusterin-associated protein 1-like Protein [Tribolium castaneum]|uniref:Clusterin-associated protein 1-like Protein n=2 Tax=Tribolium castaneum TaxID=7070 RepID=D2A571_TRICA|nr:Clusterin-associated protein 1-like Protein [Tribolium castaneum]